jgi:hypothetical protein
MKKQGSSFAPLFALLVLLTAARFLVGHAGTISSAEAYYWLLGERWEWANFEGPGGLPALVAVLGGVFGPDPVVLRMLSPLWILLGSLGLWWWARHAVSQGAAFWLVVAWNCLPAINSSSMVFGPEPLLLALWIWFGALTWRAAHDLREAPLWWSAAGVVAALGTLVSYTMLVAAAGMALFWIVDRPCWARILRKKPASRRHPPRLHPMASLVFFLPALALTGPVFWNVESNWVSFAGQTFQSLTAFGGNKIPDALAITSWEGGMVLPLLALILFAALTCTMALNRESRWLWATSVLPVGWFFLRLWRGEDAVLPMLLMFPALLLCGVQWMWAGVEDFPVRFQKWENRFRRLLLWSGIPIVLIAVLITACTQFLFRPQSTEPDWAQISERMRRVALILQVAGKPPLFFIAGESDAAAGTGFHLLGEGGTITKDFPPVYVRESQNLASQFGLWPRYDEFVDAPEVVLDEFFQEQRGFNPYVGRSALYLGAEPPDDLPQVIANGFVRVMPIERIVDPRGRVFFLYHCEDYQTAPL